LASTTGSDCAFSSVNTETPGSQPWLRAQFDVTVCKVRDPKHPGQARRRLRNIFLANVPNYVPKSLARPPARGGAIVPPEFKLVIVSGVGRAPPQIVLSTAEGNGANAPGPRLRSEDFPAGPGSPALPPDLSGFVGSLRRPGTPALSIEEINRITRKAWAGER
jgi:hypothetical protein